MRPSLICDVVCYVQGVEEALKGMKPGSIRQVRQCHIISYIVSMYTNVIIIPD